MELHSPSKAKSELIFAQALTELLHQFEEVVPEFLHIRQVLFAILPKHSALCIDDAELTEQRFTDIIRLAHCNLGCATEQLKRVAEDFERWLERRRKRDALAQAFAGEFKMPVALDQLGTKLHEGSTRIFELTFQQWDSASTFNPTTWAKEAHKKMLQLSREMPRRFIRVVLHLENGLRVYGIRGKSRMPGSRRQRLLRVGSTPRRQGIVVPAFREIQTRL